MKPKLIASKVVALQKLYTYLRSCEYICHADPNNCVHPIQFTLFIPNAELLHEARLFAVLRHEADIFHIDLVQHIHQVEQCMTIIFIVFTSTYHYLLR